MLASMTSPPSQARAEGSRCSHPPNRYQEPINGGAAAANGVGKRTCLSPPSDRRLGISVFLGSGTPTHPHIHFSHGKRGIHPSGPATQSIRTRRNLRLKRPCVARSRTGCTRPSQRSGSGTIS
ncbi:hypothetical protein XPA_004308 [Xanthoria parietina]